MRKLGLTLAGAAGLLMSSISPQAYAAVAPSGGLTISLAAGGSATVLPGPNITLGITGKTESPLSLTNLSGNLGLAAGVVPGAVVTFTPQPIPIPPTINVPIATAETITVGSLTITLNVERLESITAQSTTQAGGFLLSFTGTFHDSSGALLDSTASVAETCNQAAGPTNTPIGCSNTVVVPAAITLVPEPATLALLGAGLAGLGILRSRRRKAA